MLGRKGRKIGKPWETKREGEIGEGFWLESEFAYNSIISNGGEWKINSLHARFRQNTGNLISAKNNCRAFEINSTISINPY